MTNKQVRPAIDRDHELGLLRQMLLIRRFEEKCAELYSVTKIRGFLHLYIGEEAVSVGVMGSVAPDDGVVSTYREHGHALARGIAPGAVMAEMYGRHEGCCRGRGGSMHIFDAATRFYGGNAIVGGGIPLAAGLALADRMQGRQRLTWCFFGDGAVAEGVFHESMNIASLWRLPVVFVCENNLYAMGTAIRYAQAVTDLASKGAGYAVASEAVDGMDVLAVEAAARRATEQVRGGNGPYFLECRTYRFRAHSMFDTEQYRTKDEVEEWRKRDPITFLTSRLKEHEALDDAGLASLEGSVAEEVAAAVAFAEGGSWEPVEELTRFVCSDRSNG